MNDKNIVLQITDMKQTVYVYKCQNSVIQVLLISFLFFIVRRTYSSIQNVTGAFDLVFVPLDSGVFIPIF